MATINAAERFGLKRLGAVAPGYHANLVLFDNLAEFKVSLVVSSGKVVFSNGEIAVNIPRTHFTDGLTDSVHVGDFDTDRLRVTTADGLCRVIDARDGQLVTDSLLMEPAVISNRVAADIERDILKIAVVERHKATGNVGVGLIHGFGLKRGALASSVAHDAHNIVVVGASDTDMALAVKRIEELHGGLVVVSDGKVIAELPLPIGGLMTDLTYEEACNQLSDLEDAARDLGSSMVHPFMILSFMALEVIPELKITDRGLVDVSAGKFVGLFTGREESAAARASSG
jgi:adenine deaminase